MANIGRLLEQCFTVSITKQFEINTTLVARFHILKNTVSNTFSDIFQARQLSRKRKHIDNEKRKSFQFVKRSAKKLE